MLKNTTTGTSKSLGHIHGIQNIDFQETEVQLYILVYKILYWPTEVFIPALSKIKILGLTVTLNSARLQCLVCEKNYLHGGVQHYILLKNHSYIPVSFKQ